MEDKHIIGRQRFHLKVKKKEGAGFVFSQVSQVVKNRLTEEIDKLFTKHSPEGQIIRIDTLKLDVGTISQANFQQEILTKVLQALEQQLPALLADNAPEVEEVTKATSNYELLSFFLVHGCLPWWAEKSRSTSLSDLLMVVLKDSPTLLYDLLSEVMQNPAAFQRVQHQFSSESLMIVNENFAPEAWGHIQEDIAFLSDLNLHHPFSSGSQQKDIQKVLLTISTKLIASSRKPPANPQEWMALILAEMAKVYQTSSAALQTHFVTAVNLRSPLAAKDWTAGQKARAAKLKALKPDTANPTSEAETSYDLNAILTYIRRGTTPSSGPLRSAGKIEALIRKWILDDDLHFQPIFRKLLRDKATIKQVHKTFSWPTLQSIHQWIWGSYWQTVSSYLQDFGTLVRHTKITSFSEDHLRRLLLEDWLIVRLDGISAQSPFPSGKESETSTTSIQKMWTEILTRSLSKLERESGRSFKSLLSDLQLLSETSENVWKSNLPKILSTLQPPDGTSKFGNLVPVKAIAVFRFLIERGYLPEGYARNGLARLEEDIYQRTTKNNQALLDMLAIVLSDGAMFLRFRRNTALRILHSLAFQLAEVSADPSQQPSNTELAPALPNSDSNEDLTKIVPGEDLSPEATTGESVAGKSSGPSEDAKFTVEDLSTMSSTIADNLLPAVDADQATRISDTDNIDRFESATTETRPSNDHDGPTGSTIDNTGEAAPPLQTPLAPKPPLHLRPRQEQSHGRNHHPAPWALFFNNLKSLFQDNTFWTSDWESFQRFSYSFIVRQRLDKDNKPITLATLIKGWAEAISQETRQPWSVIAAALGKAAADNPLLTEPLRNALQQVANLAPVARAKTQKELQEAVVKNEKESAVSAEGKEELQKNIQAWANWITKSTGAKTVNKQDLSLSVFDSFLTSESQELSLLQDLIGQQQIFPDSILNNLPVAKTKVFIDQLVTKLPGGFADSMAAFYHLVVSSKIYPDNVEATRQISRYALLLLLGKKTALRQLSALTEKLLAMIAKEHLQTTSALAGTLLEKVKKDNIAPELLLTLHRIVAKLSPAEVEKITSDTGLLSKEVIGLKPGVRDGHFYRTVLIHHLKKGESPWWEEANDRLDQLFAHAVAADIQSVLKLLSKRPILANRLFPFLPVTELRQFIKKLFPGYADFLFAWTELLESLEQQQLLASNISRASAWIPVWEYALLNKPFTSRKFLDYALQATSQAYAIAPKNLVLLVTNQVSVQVHLGNVQYYRLAALLRERQDDDSVVTAIKTIDSAEAVRPTDETSEEALLHPAASTEGPAEDLSVGDSTGSEEASKIDNSDGHGQSMKSAQKGTPGIVDAANEVGVYAERSQSIGAGDVFSENSDRHHNPEPAVIASYGALLEIEIKQLQHFLFYGTPLAGYPPLRRQELSNLQERIIRLHPEVARPVYRAVLSDRVARKRLIRLFSVDLWRAILRLLLGRKIRWVENLWSDLELLLPGLLRQFRSSDFLKTTSIHLLIYPAARHKNPDLTNYPEDLLDSIARKDGSTLEKLFVSLQQSLQQPPPGLQEDWKLILAGIQKRKTTDFTEDKEIDSSTNTRKMEQSVYIHNSGLVILGAYLSRYFEMLGMIKNKAFRSEQDATRGVLLLEYLASGRTEVAEHELAFNKVLCGLPLTTPVPGSIELTDEEKEVSDQMLNAILQNWDKMSNSTVENLQGSFLLRNGILVEQADHWSLQVESAGFDVLLSFLPWTISIISLPWVSKRLEVDWNSSIQ